MSNDRGPIPSSIREASYRFGNKKATDNRDNCYHPAVGYVSQPHGKEHAIIRRVPEYRERYSNRVFVGYTEEVVFTGSETEVEKRLRALLEELWEKERQEGADKRVAKKRKKKSPPPGP